jgi:hypothetical protein
MTVIGIERKEEVSKPFPVFFSVFSWVKKAEKAKRRLYRCILLYLFVIYAKQE